MRKIILLIILAIVGGGSAYLFQPDIARVLFKYNMVSLHPNLIKESALLLDLGPEGIDLTPLGKRGIGSSMITEFESMSFFDIDNDGFAERMSWPKGSDAFIAHDINKNDKIDNQTELFGMDANNFNGFKKLAKFDSNNDGIISAKDKIYDELLIWQDSDGNGYSRKEELKKLSGLKIDEINLDFTTPRTNLNSGSKVTFQGSYKINGMNRIVEDIQLKKSNISTRYLKEATLDVRVLFLPTLKGFGNLPDLHFALSNDKLLLNQLLEITKSFISSERLKNPEQLKLDIESIFFRWAGCEEVKKDSRGPFVDAQHLTFIEKLTGSNYGEDVSYPYNHPQNEIQGEAVEKSYQMAIKSQMSFLINQMISEKLYSTKPVYSLAAGDMSKATLSSDGVKYLEGLATSLPIDKRKIFWMSMIDIILPVKQQGKFDAKESSMLNESITRTLSTENLDTLISYANTR